MEYRKDDDEQMKTIFVKSSTSSMGRMKLAQIIILLYSIIHSSSSSRIIPNPTSKSHRHYVEHETISFLMRDVLNEKLRPTTTQLPGNQVLFPKPLGLFPPADGIPLPDSNPGTTEPLGLTNPGFTFPTIATLQELELGSITEIDEYLFRETIYGMEIAGRARGVYVASSGDSSSHMMAMTVYFSSEKDEDALRFFGVHRKDVLESHVAVIGGTGKYSGANGYTAIKPSIGDGSSSTAKEGSKIAYLLFNVYLS